MGALLAAQLCLGAAHIAALPPWEGFDEPGHFSSIQQIADMGEVPRLPEARMSALIAKYSKDAPRAYATRPPFDHNGGWTYERFFAAGPSTIEAGRRAVHDAPSAPRRFAPGADQNYIAQHPPLYALVMAPIYAATRGLSLSAQLLVLRLATYTMAWLALAGGIVVLMRWPGDLPSGRVAVVAAALWPLFMPSWFPAMARLGNDSLTALLVAILWAWIAARGCRSVTSALVIGLLLGAGAVTKAFFVPIAAGTLAWCVASGWRGTTRDRAAALGRAALSAAVMGTSAAWWYAGPSAVAVAGTEAQMLAGLGGLGPALRRHFSIGGWLDGGAAFLGQAAWSGTWSVVHPPHLLLAPLLLALLGGGALYVGAAWRQRLATISWLPAWWLAPLLIGFACHILVHLALRGTGRGVGGYYLHVLVAPLACTLGWAVAHAWRRGTGRAAARTCLAYAALFILAMAWAQLLLFTGVLTKNAAKQYAAVGALPAWIGVPEALTRLDALAFPRATLVLAALGTVLLASGLIAVTVPVSRQAPS